MPTPEALVESLILLARAKGPGGVLFNNKRKKRKNGVQKVYEA
jgi:hypothetical protein